MLKGEIKGLTHGTLILNELSNINTEREGYTFSGWLYKGELISKETRLRKGGMSVTSYYTPKYFNVIIEDGNTWGYKGSYRYNTPLSDFLNEIEVRSYIKELEKDSIISIEMDGNIIYKTNEINNTNILITKDIKLTINSNRIIITYKLSFFNDGTIINGYPIDVEPGTIIKYPTMDNINKDGIDYVFKWSGDNYNGKPMPEYDLQITGKYEAIDAEKYHTLTWNLDGRIQENKVKEGEIIVNYKPVGWEVEGKTILWYLDGRPLSNNDKMPKYDLTINGQYSNNSYVLTFIIDDKTIKQQYSFGSTILYPVCDEIGYEYIWEDNSYNGQPMPDHDLTIRGSKKLKEYTITYYIVHKGSDSGRQEIIAKHGDNLLTLLKNINITNITGYTFGWYSDRGGNNPISENIIITGPMTVYGVHVVNKWTIHWSFVSNDDNNFLYKDYGEYPNYQGYINNVEFGTNLMDIINSLNLNYDLRGYYYDEKDGKPEWKSYYVNDKNKYIFNDLHETMPDNNINICVNYLCEKYTFTWSIPDYIELNVTTFNPNGSVVVKFNHNIYDEAIKYGFPKFSSDDYTNMSTNSYEFKGWYYEEDGQQKLFEREKAMPWNNLKIVALYDKIRQKIIFTYENNTDDNISILLRSAIGDKSEDICCLDDNLKYSGDTDYCEIVESDDESEYFYGVPVINNLDDGYVYQIDTPYQYICETEVSGSTGCVYQIPFIENNAFGVVSAMGYTFKELSKYNDVENSENYSTISTYTVKQLLLSEVSEIKVYPSVSDEKYIIFEDNYGNEFKRIDNNFMGYDNSYWDATPDDFQNPNNQNGSLSIKVIERGEKRYANVYYNLGGQQIFIQEDGGTSAKITNINNIVCAKKELLDDNSDTGTLKHKWVMELYIN